MMGWKHTATAMIMGAIAANVAVVQVVDAKSLTEKEIYNVANKFVVKIGGADGGSGFIVRKNGNRYTVLTNDHVTKTSSQHTITTHDGKIYTSESVRSFKSSNSLDLAEIEFTSDRQYQAAVFSPQNDYGGGSKVYIVGFNATSYSLTERVTLIVPATIAGSLKQGKDGYTITMNMNAVPGMSGSPLLDESGRVIGMYGHADTQTRGETSFVTFSLGIPISTYSKLIQSDRLVASKSLTVNAINNLANIFVVRIDGSRGASGFIVRKNGNRYTVLTNDHVTKTSDRHTITTHDGKTYTSEGVKSFKSSDGLDLAEIEFESGTQYSVAQLATKPDYSIGSKVYSVGWSAANQNLTERMRNFLDGTILGSQPSGSGYIIKMNLVAIPGMSGSPLLDENGKVVGIYGRAIQTITFGIPISAYRNVAPSSTSVVDTIPIDRTPVSVKPSQSGKPVTSANSSGGVSDIAGNWAEPFIRVLVEKDIIKGYSDGSFRPNRPITRAEFSALLNRAFELQAVRAGRKFKDVSSNNWADNVIQKAYQAGFVAGYPNGTFAPNQNILRIQSLVSLVNGSRVEPSGNLDLNTIFSDAEQVPAYGQNALVAATQRCVAVSVEYDNSNFRPYNDPTRVVVDTSVVVKVPNDRSKSPGGNFGPNTVATRADVAAYLHQLLVAAGRLPALDRSSPANKYIASCPNGTYVNR
jgi:S1-C subfamily serine protease